ncbi:MAG: Pvc16 family protein [Cyanobacteria bacterium P01_A01_bin.114]
MISAATQTLADFIANGIALVSKDRISFEHPRMQHKGKPALNLYCYRVQASGWNHLLNPPDNSRVSTLPEIESSTETKVCQWFDLTFLVSVSDHTALAEQHLLSEVLAMLSGYPSLPEEFLSPLLRGQGQLPMTVSTEAVMDTLLLWQVLRTPLRLALHVTITVPFYRQLGFYS